jgi:hypothetical protein
MPQAGAPGHCTCAQSSLRAGELLLALPVRAPAAPIRPHSLAFQGMDSLKLLVEAGADVALPSSKRAPGRVVCCCACVELAAWDLGCRHRHPPVLGSRGGAGGGRPLPAGQGCRSGAAQGAPLLHCLLYCAQAIILLKMNVGQ